MRKAFSALGFLVVITVICIMYFLFWNGSKSPKSIVNERKVIEQKQQIVNEQIKDIQNARAIQKKQLKESLEQNY